MKKIFFLLCVLSSLRAFSGDFYFGNDLSYVNQMEDAGVIYKQNNQPKDLFQIFADQGTNLVRVRLWYDPSWWQSPLQQPEGVKPWYSDYEDVKKTIRRAKDKGMQVMLDIHYSDFWADPGRQLVPREWVAVAGNTGVLADSVYRYTKRVLTGLNNEGLMPDLVKVGNETNSGLLSHLPTDNGFEIKSTVSSSWSRHAQLYNAAFRAIREVGAVATVNPKIVLHFSNSLSGQLWNYQNVINNGITDFDIMGISYYYAWHQGSIAELESTLKGLKSKFPAYDVMVAETGYLWTTTNYDNLPNIIATPDPDFLPVTPQNQLRYMVEYTKAVMRAGGVGVIFWEPAWVSTACRTPWGVGSSHDHVAFFEPSSYNFMENGGGKWTNPEHYTELNPSTKSLVTFQVDMTGQDVSKGVFIVGEMTSWSFVTMQHAGNQLYSVQLELNEGDQHIYYYIRKNGWDNYEAYRETIPEACSDSHLKPGGWVGDRLITVPKNDTVVSSVFSACSITGSDELLHPTLKVYPNPSAGQFYIHFANTADYADMIITSTDGRNVAGKRIGAGESPFRVDLSGLPASVYHLQLRTGRSVLHHNLILH